MQFITAQAWPEPGTDFSEGFFNKIPARNALLPTPHPEARSRAPGVDGGKCTQIREHFAVQNLADNIGSRVN